MRICVFEDAGVTGLEPLTLTRPAFALRCGARTLLERQLGLAGGPAGVLVRPELAQLCRQAHPELAVNDPDWLGRGPVLLVNGRWLPPAGPPAAPGPGEVGLVGDEVAYVRLPGGEAAELTADDLAWRLAGWKQALRQRPAGGRLLAYPWDLVEHNAAALEQDGHDWCSRRDVADRPQVAVVGPRERFVADPEAQVEPLVVVDTTRGPVLVDRGAVVQAFSRLEGPCYVGPQTQVLGARLRGSSLGPQCRVGGEVECSVIQGYSNKAHEGFLGHSYVGEWVNLGAGTQVSDLRVDYGPASVRLGGRRVDTGLLKVGAYLGDHTKTSVAALLNQGTVAGPFSLLLSSGGLMPRALPPFCQYAHGQVQERSDLRQLFATAAVVMARRGRQWTAAHAELFFGLFERTEAGRRQLIRESEQRRLRRVV